MRWALKDQDGQGEVDEGEAAGVGEARGGKFKRGEGRAVRQGERWARQAGWGKAGMREI